MAAIIAHEHRAREASAPEHRRGRRRATADGPLAGQHPVVGLPDFLGAGLIIVLARAFTGALQGFHADKGVFITTSRFTDDARTYAAGIQTRVVLIDGAELAELMIDHGVGV